MSVSKWATQQTYYETRVTSTSPKELAEALTEIMAESVKWHGVVTEEVAGLVYSVEDGTIVIRFAADSSSVGGW